MGVVLFCKLAETDVREPQAVNGDRAAKSPGDVALENPPTVERHREGQVVNRPHMQYEGGDEPDRSLQVKAPSDRLKISA